MHKVGNSSTDCSVIADIRLMSYFSVHSLLLFSVSLSKLMSSQFTRIKLLGFS